MKHWILAAFCVLGLTACANDYIITTTDGQLFTSDGKPELDEDTGMISFEDADGNKQQLKATSVKQMIER
jgi:hypothetical protein